MRAPTEAVLEAATAYVDARSEDWGTLLQTLICERSVFEHEQGIVELVADHVQRLGLIPVRVPHDAERLAALPGAQRPFSSVSNRCSLVVRLPGRGGGRSLALNAHLDVVPEGDAAAWTHPPFVGHVDPAQHVIYGRGAMDDKAGVAIVLAVMETLARTPVPLAGDVVFQFVLEDETTGNGSLLCLSDGHGADAAIIVDGTRPSQAIDQHAGQQQFNVVVLGKPASVSVSHLGINAADLLARFVTRLADRVAALNVGRQPPWDRFPSPFQLVIQRLDAVADVMTVPAQAEATCFVTFPPPCSLADMRRVLDDEARLFAAERGYERAPSLDYGGFHAEPVTAANSGSLVEALNAAALTVGLGPVMAGPSTGTSDLRHFAAAGIPCVLYGPGNGFNPHRADEHYNLSHLAAMAKLFVTLIIDWCGAPRRTDSA